MSKVNHSVFDTRELDDLARGFGLSEKEVQLGISNTLNYFAQEVLDLSISKIGAELNLPESYIKGKLSVSAKAKPTKLEAVISAESRHILLSRFDPIAQWKPGKTKSQVPAGVSVKVKPNGGRSHMRSAFMIPLKRGVTSGAGAKGLAYRPRKDEDYSFLSPSAKREVSKRGFAVLHGPSVHQVFTTFLDELPPSAEEMFSYLLEQLEVMA